MRRPNPRNKERSELADALHVCRGAFVAIALISGVSNVLMLTSAIFMLEVYDRVIPSRSVPTLVGLLILAVGLYAVLGLLEAVRSRVLVRIGGSLDEALSARIYETIVRLPLKIGDRGDGLRPLRDLDTVRGFLAGAGPGALFDLPWIPIYLVVCFLFHPLIGLAALIGAVVLAVVTLLTAVLVRQPTRIAAGYGSTRDKWAETSRRNAEAIVAMGMTGRLAALWGQANINYVESQRRAGDVIGGLGSLSRILRMMLQSAVLAVGAYLVIFQEATAGIMIAGSIVSARALAPVDQAIANWRNFVGARQAWRRLTDLLELLPSHTKPMTLLPPSKTLIVEGASAVPPGGSRVVVENVSFALKGGNGLGILGPSASGKTSLVRMLVGVWRPVKGRIRLDGAALDQWSPDLLGQHIGYLPQDVELLRGTVAQNISRFTEPADQTTIIAAAEAAGVHDLIVGLPEGYETQVGEAGTGLSAGQSQRIALARALFGNPFLVVLDEPNSNLDAEGEEALSRAILGVRSRGGIVVVVSHRSSVIAGVDLLLTMKQGRPQVFGPKDEVLAHLREATALTALKVVPDREAAKS
jgi:PrtD family type I secretion system ABC transporter